MAGKMSNWTRQILRTGDVEKIELAVVEAEKKTDGEIVPMLVRSSTNTGSVRLIIALILFILFVFIEHEFDHFSFDDSYNYMMPLFLVFFYFLALPLSKIRFFQKWLTSPVDQISDVNLRAEIEFYRGKYHQTKKKSAILLFVSLMEKRAVVLADESVAQKVDQEKWNEVVHLITSHIAQGDFALGMAKAIQRSGEILAQYVPVTSSVKNEVGNHFIIQD